MLFFATAPAPVYPVHTLTTNPEAVAELTKAQRAALGVHVQDGCSVFGAFDSAKAARAFCDFLFCLGDFDSFDVEQAQPGLWVVLAA